MSRDAKFEDAAPGPLRLQALTPEDLTVLSALVQDAVFPITEMTFDRPARRFAVLLNRFRWEGGAVTPERVQAVLAFDTVSRVQFSGIDRGDRDQILSVLSMTLDGDSERVILTLSGDGAIAVDAAALDVSLRDVTQSYRAVSGRAPRHTD